MRFCSSVGEVMTHDLAPQTSTDSIRMHFNDSTTYSKVIFLLPLDGGLHRAELLKRQSFNRTKRIVLDFAILPVAAAEQGIGILSMGLDFQMVFSRFRSH